MLFSSKMEHFLDIWIFVCVSLWIIQLELPVVSNAEVTLSPSVAEVIENEDVKLTCKYHGTIQQVSSTWKRSADETLNPSISLRNDVCSASGFLNNVEKYDWNCLERNMFTLTLKQVGRNQHGIKWKCSQNFEFSDDIVIFVQVPVAYVNINTKSIYTGLENSTVLLSCQTSYCRPTATIAWFLDAGTSERTDDIIISTENQTLQNTTNDEGFVSVSSTLRFSLNRSENNWSIYCSGNNINNRNASLSQETKLNIIYPPDGAPLIKGFSNDSVYHVIEGQLGNLSCTITGGNPSANLEWYCNGGQVEQVNKETIVVTWRAKRNQNKSCECTANHTITGIISTKVAVNVLYPPSYPDFSIASSPVYVIVNKTITINCTSDSIPLPTYKWILPDSSTLLGQSLHIENVKKTDSGTYSCTAENHMFPSYGDKVTGRNTSSIDINILFPPTKPVFRYGNSSGAAITSNSFYVVENDTFSVACGSNGNPKPTLTWSGEKEDLAMLTISSISTDLTKTCFATNTMNETIGGSRTRLAEANLSIIILYPPRQPTLKYLNSDGIKKECVPPKFGVIEDTSFSLSCITDGRPEPRYSWYGPITSKIAELEFEKINRMHKGEYSCNAFNEMKRTYGSSQDGNNSQKVTLNILYPPVVDYLENQTYIEGSTLNLNCPVKNGNPVISTVIWTRNGDKRQWNTRLNIANVQRNDDMIYTCTAFNTMTPSCENQTEGYGSKSFHLNVVYKASVVNFYVNKLMGQPEVTVNENDSLEFSCHTDSKPKSLIKIGFNSDILISQSDVNSLTIDNLIATCSRDGVYSCSGNNTYNEGKYSNKYLTLRVKCFPRVSPNVYVRDRIYTNENESVSFNFTALAYPVPGQSGFKWQRQYGLKWSTLNNGPHVKITTSGLKTNLTIFNVTKLDFGKYRLSIENEIGLYEQTFYLIGKAPPDKPSEFRVVQDELTDTAVTLMWKPGFNYGSLPYYILQYKELVDNEWISVKVMDRMGETLNYTIHDLSSDTEYMVIIFAISDLGSSDNQSLVFQTKGKSVEQTETHSAVVIGLLTALSISSVVNIGLIMLMLYMKKGCWCAKGHLTPHKTKEDKVKLRASCHSFTDHTGASNSGAYEDVQNVAGQDNTMVSKGYTRLHKLNETVAGGKLAMYEEIKTPGTEDKKKIIEDGGYEVPVSKKEITMSAKDNKASSGEAKKAETKTSPNYKQMNNEGEEAISEQHKNLTEYINLDDLSKKKV